MVSIIVPAYNCEKYIKNCIISLINQTYKFIEVIIINDGSTDSTRKICEQLEDTDTRIKLHTKKNEGVSKARNDGIRLCRGEYIIFVDADDYLNIDSVEIMISTIEKNKSDIVIGNYNTIHFNKLKKNTNYKTKLYTKRDFVNDILNHESKLHTPWGKLFKSRIIKGNKLFFDVDMTICEDTKFNIEYLKFCENIFVQNKIVYNYRLGGYASSIKFHKDINLMTRKVCDEYKELEGTNELLINKIELKMFSFAIDHYFLHCNAKNIKECLKKTRDLYLNLIFSKEFMDSSFDLKEVQYLKNNKIFKFYWHHKLNKFYIINRGKIGKSIRNILNKITKVSLMED